MATSQPLDDLLAKLVCGVSIVTTAWEGSTYGLAVAWASRVSFKPPLLMVSIGTERYTHDMIAKSGIFAVNVMDRSEIDLVRLFGSTSGKDQDKFAGVSHSRKATGAPILAAAAASFDCRVVHQYAAGDHTLFVGEILDAALLHDTQPLVYQRSDFR
ncbi:MAG: hypothetical protein A2Z34_03320 [Planctomycetes bacterium RBG_16_59_8]|nr:MAG: hypothetical protein A2Z34_03320 [Planctomycetes bacterium RBG_16_59_8]